MPDPSDARTSPLTARITQPLREAIERRCRETGESVDQIVQAALADYLQVGQSTLFQVSTAGALVEGIYRGAMTVADLRAHGDLGLGTFEGLDGEMVVVDGRFFQVRADGSVHEVADDVRSPYAVLTRFDPEPPVDLGHCGSLEELQARLDGLRTSDNIFYAVRIDGDFKQVRTRAVPRTAEGVPLVEAAANQPEFAFRNLRGTLVGFWSPRYVRTLTVPGYHLHFLSEDRTAGGTCSDASGEGLAARLERESNLRLALPRSAAFLGANFDRDASDDLDRAERASRREGEARA